MPSSTASRTIEFTWPSSAMCSGSRSSVQKAIRCGPYSRTSGSRSRRLRARGLADQQPHPGAQPLPALLDRVRLVVGADPGGGVRVERLPEHARRVAVHVDGAVEARASRARAGRRRRRRGSSSSPRGRAPAAGGAAPPSRRWRAAGAATRTSDAGTDDEAMKKTSSGVAARVEEPVDAVGPEHVRELVRVGDDRRRPERQHEAGELVDQELRRLDVDVRVDEARDDLAPEASTDSRPSYSPRPATAPSTTATSVSSHSRVKTESTRPPRTTTSAGSSPRATASRRASSDMRRELTGAERVGLSRGSLDGVDRERLRHPVARDHATHSGSAKSRMSAGVSSAALPAPDRGDGPRVRGQVLAEAGHRRVRIVQRARWPTDGPALPRGAGWRSNP